MKKLICILMIAMCAFIFTSNNAFARKKDSSSGKAGKPKSAAQKKTKELLDKIRLGLEGSEWNVNFSGGKDVKSDMMFFKDSQVSSKYFLNEGFNPTNYSLNIQENELVVFETMQTSEKSGTLFWRGELSKDGNSMQGMVSQVLPDKKSEDLYFSASRIQAVEPVIAEGEIAVEEKEIVVKDKK